MVRVKEIVDSETGEKYIRLVIGSFTTLGSPMGGVYCVGLDKCSNIKVCIRDISYDNDKWYTVLELFDLIDSTGLSLLGFKINRNIKDIHRIMEKIERNCEVVIGTVFEGYSDDEIYKALRYKFLGFDFDEYGKVSRIPKGQVKGGVLYIPSILRRFSFTLEYEGRDRFHTISVCKDFDSKDRDSVNGMYKLITWFETTAILVRRD